MLRSHSSTPYIIPKWAKMVPEVRFELYFVVIRIFCCIGESPKVGGEITTFKTFEPLFQRLNVYCNGSLFAKTGTKRMFYFSRNFVRILYRHRTINTDMNLDRDV